MPTAPSVSAPSVLHPAGSYLIDVSCRPCNRKLCHAGHVIGKGSYGTVYSGTLHGVQVAIKKIIYRDTSPVSDEVYASISLDHPNLVKTYVAYRRKASIHDCATFETRCNSLNEPAIDHQHTSDSPYDATCLSVWSSTSLSHNTGSFELLECFIVQACRCTTNGRDSMKALCVWMYYLAVPTVRSPSVVCLYSVDIIAGTLQQWEFAPVHSERTHGWALTIEALPFDGD